MTQVNAPVKRIATSTVLEISTHETGKMRTPVVLTMDKEYMNAILGDDLAEKKIGSIITDFTTGKQYSIKEISFMVTTKKYFWEGQPYQANDFKGVVDHDDLPSAWIRVIVEPIH